MQILLIFLSGMVLLLVIGLLLFSPDRLPNVQQLRGAGKKRGSYKVIDLQRSLLEQEEALSQDKESIQLAVKSRNLSLRILNHMRDLGKEILEYGQIDPIDQQILTKFSVDLKLLTKEIESLRDKYPGGVSAELEELYRITINSMERLDTLSGKTLKKSDQEAVLQDLDQEMQSNYDTLVQLHTKMIGNFQKKFSSQTR